MAQKSKSINRGIEAKSKQPRFSEPKPETFYNAVFQWVKMAGQDAPLYQADTRKRDAWLTNFWHLEPHLAGVLQSVVSIDANRGWTLIGGRNQVMRYTKILHNWAVAPGLYGWRPGCAAAAQSFYTADLGGLVEIGRDGKNGPVRGFFHTDPTLCKTTNNIDLPLRYYPSKGKVQDWRESDFMRIVSMPSILEAHNGIGYSAISRCLELAQIMVAVIQHDKEELGAQAPRGLLLLQGVSQANWENALSSRKIRMEGNGYEYFDAVMVLASEGLDSIDAKIMALSNLPANFDLTKFTQLLIYGYAMCFGYDPGEFYPVQYGTLGRGVEGEIQAKKATAKGALNFILALQEQLQRDDVLPPALSFEFEQRDDEGEIAQAQVQSAWVDVFKTMREAGQMLGDGAISRDEMRSLLAEHEIIPGEWTEREEPTVSTDTQSAEDKAVTSQPPEESALSFKIKKQTREELLANDRIMLCATTMPDEPLIRYRSKINRIKVLADRAGDLLKPISFPGVRLKKREIPNDQILFEDKDGEFNITQSDVNNAIMEASRRVSPEFASAIGSLPLTEEESKELDDIS